MFAIRKLLVPACMIIFFVSCLFKWNKLWRLKKSHTCSFPIFLCYRSKSNDNFPSVGIHLTNGHDLLRLNWAIAEIVMTLLFAHYNTCVRVWVCVCACVCALRVWFFLSILRPNEKEIGWRKWGKWRHLAKNILMICSMMIEVSGFSVITVFLYCMNRNYIYV